MQEGNKMKNILLSVFIATISSICNAQSNVIEGFMGFEWGSSLEEVSSGNNKRPYQAICETEEDIMNFFLRYNSIVNKRYECFLSLIGSDINENMRIEGYPIERIRYEFFCKGERNDCKYVSATVSVESEDHDLRVRDIFIQRIEENYDYEETKRESSQSDSKRTPTYVYEYSLFYDENKRIDSRIESSGSFNSCSECNRSNYLTIDASRRFDREFFEYMNEKRKSLDEESLEEESCEEKRRKGLTTFCI